MLFLQHLRCFWSLSWRAVLANPLNLILMGLHQVLHPPALAFTCLLLILLHPVFHGNSQFQQDHLPSCFFNQDSVWSECALCDVPWEFELSPSVDLQLPVLYCCQQSSVGWLGCWCCFSTVFNKVMNHFAGCFRLQLEIPVLTTSAMAFSTWSCRQWPGTSSSVAQTSTISSDLLPVSTPPAAASLLTSSGLPPPATQISSWISWYLVEASSWIALESCPTRCHCPLKITV